MKYKMEESRGYELNEMEKKYGFPCKSCGAGNLYESKDLCWDLRGCARTKMINEEVEQKKDLIDPNNLDLKN